MVCRSFGLHITVVSPAKTTCSTTFCRELCKNGWNDRDAVWVIGSGGPKETCVTRGAHWRNLANTIEPSVCGGNAALGNRYIKLLWTLVTIVVVKNEEWKLFLLCCTKLKLANFGATAKSRANVGHTGSGPEFHFNFRLSRVGSLLLWVELGRVNKITRTSNSVLWLYHSWRSEVSCQGAAHHRHAADWWQMK